MRPINGGRLDLADDKGDGWLYEPKINGWRVLANTATGECFNRHGGRMSIEREISPMLPELKHLDTWLDIEFLERRGTGKGILIVLDITSSPMPYEARMEALKGLPLFPLSGAEKGVYRLPQMQYSEAMIFWKENDVKSINGVVVEGVVAKRRDSRYILQTSPGETAKWVKHRFAES